MPYVGEVYSRSIMTVGKFGVAFPVPNTSSRNTSPRIEEKGDRTKRKQQRQQGAVGQRRQKHTQEESQTGVDHKVDEFIAQAPEFKGDLDGNQGEKDFEMSHPFDSGVEPLDLPGVLCDQLSREDVGPELAGLISLP
jgi:hypothetical protein